jgi:hypothetical protein
LLPYVQLQGRHRQRPHRQGKRRRTSTKAASTNPSAWPNTSRGVSRCGVMPIAVVIAAATATATARPA